MNWALNFLWIEWFFLISSSYCTSLLQKQTKVTKVSLWIETWNKCGKRSVVWKNNKTGKRIAIFWKLINWNNWNIDKIESSPRGYIFRFRALLQSEFPELLTPLPWEFSECLPSWGCGFFLEYPIDCNINFLKAKTKLN